MTANDNPQTPRPENAAKIIKTAEANNWKPEEEHDVQGSTMTYTLTLRAPLLDQMIALRWSGAYSEHTGWGLRYDSKPVVSRLRDALPVGGRAGLLWITSYLNAFPEPQTPEQAEQWKRAAQTAATDARQAAYEEAVRPSALKPEARTPLPAATPSIDLTAQACAPLTGTTVLRPGEGCRPEHADHPVIRAVVADLAAAGHTPSVATSDDDDHTDGFFVGLREGDRVTVWYYSGGNFVFYQDGEGIPLRDCYRALLSRGWSVSRGTRVVEVNSDTRVPSTTPEEDTAATYGYHPDDAAERPEVLDAVKVLERASWEGARMVGHGVWDRGFMVVSDGGTGAAVRVYTYLDGRLVDMDNDADDDWAERHLNAYAFELNAAGWDAELKNSHSVRATPPQPAEESAGQAATGTRYAYQVQTRLNGGEWLDVDICGVDRSDESARRFAAAVLGREALPPVNDAREVRAVVWNLDKPGQPVTMDALRVPDQD